MAEPRAPHASPDDPHQPPAQPAGASSPGPNLTQNTLPLPGEAPVDEDAVAPRPSQGVSPSWEAGWEQIFERLDAENRRALSVYLRALARLPNQPSLDNREQLAIREYIMGRIRALLRPYSGLPDEPPTRPMPDLHAPLEVKGSFAPPKRPAQYGPPLMLIPKPPPSEPAPDYRRVLPQALRLPLLHAALSFAILYLLPSHPLSMPTAIGLAAALIIYVQWLADRRVR